MADVAFKNTADVLFLDTTDVKWIKGITAVDCSANALTLAAALSATSEIQIVCAPLTIITAISIVAIEADFITKVAAEPLIVSSALSAKISIDLLTPVLSLGSGLSCAPQLQIVSAPFISQATISGTPMPIFIVVAPQLQVASALSSNVSILLLPGALTLSGLLSVNNTAIFIDHDYVTTYLCVLTGTTDITIPISSFQGRFRSGDPSYLSCVVPGLDYADAITARSSGDLEIWMKKTYKDGNIITERLAVVDLEDIRIDEGTESQSISLEGHRTETYSAKSINLVGANYKNITKGKTRYRCQPNIFLRPGDTVTINGDTFVADVISYAISVASRTMEVAEA